MILDSNGIAIEGAGRRNGNIDGFQLTSGAVVSVSASLKLHRMIRDNVGGLRDRIEQADKDQAAFLERRGLGAGKVNETLHLSMLRHDDDAMPGDKEEALIRNQAFGEKVMRERVKNEGKDLEGSKAGYEKLTA